MAIAGTTSQSQTSTSIIDSNRVSTLSASNDVNLQAGNDVVVRGGQVEAGRDINVKGRDITFDVARGTQFQGASKLSPKQEGRGAQPGELSLASAVAMAPQLRRVARALPPGFPILTQGATSTWRPAGTSV